MTDPRPALAETRAAMSAAPAFVRADVIARLDAVRDALDAGPNPDRRTAALADMDAAAGLLTHAPELRARVLELRGPVSWALAVRTERVEMMAEAYAATFAGGHPGRVGAPVDWRAASPVDIIRELVEAQGGEWAEQDATPFPMRPCAVCGVATDIAVSRSAGGPLGACEAHVKTVRDAILNPQPRVVPTTPGRFVNALDAVQAGEGHDFSGGVRGKHAERYGAAGPDGPSMVVYACRCPTVAPEGGKCATCGDARRVVGTVVNGARPAPSGWRIGIDDEDRVYIESDTTDFSGPAAEGWGFARPEPRGERSIRDLGGHAFRHVAFPDGSTMWSANGKAWCGGPMRAPAERGNEIPLAEFEAAWAAAEDA